MGRCWFRGFCTRRCSHHPASHFCKGRGRLYFVFATHISSRNIAIMRVSWSLRKSWLLCRFQSKPSRAMCKLRHFPQLIGAGKLLEKFAWTTVLVAVFIRWPLSWDQCEESRLKAQSSWKLSGSVSCNTQHISTLPRLRTSCDFCLVCLWHLKGSNGWDQGSNLWQWVIGLVHFDRNIRIQNSI